MEFFSYFFYIMFNYLRIFNNIIHFIFGLGFIFFGFTSSSSDCWLVVSRKRTCSRSYHQLCLKFLAILKSNLMYNYNILCSLWVTGSWLKSNWTWDRASLLIFEIISSSLNCFVALPSRSRFLPALHLCTSDDVPDRQVGGGTLLNWIQWHDLT